MLGGMLTFSLEKYLSGEIVEKHHLHLFGQDGVCGLSFHTAPSIIQLAIFGILL